VALARQALDLDLITPETANAVKGIAVLRNLAAHDRMSRLSSAQAQEYLSLVDATIFAVRQKPMLNPVDKGCLRLAMSAGGVQLPGMGRPCSAVTPYCAN